MSTPLPLFAALLAPLAALHAADPILIADFEGPDYGGWTTTGTAFGAGPAHGALPSQMAVEGFLGKGLVSVNLSAGQWWYFTPRAPSKKTYFVVVS